MKRIAILLLSVTGCLCLGCAGTMPGPGQPFPGSIYSSTTMPAGMSLNEEYTAHPERFEVLGLTEGTSTNQGILGIVSFGNGGYIAAMEDAMTKVGADGLINCVADIQQTSVLFLFSSSKTIVRGLAIKRIE